MKQERIKEGREEGGRVEGRKERRNERGGRKGEEEGNTIFSYCELSQYVRHYLAFGEKKKIRNSFSVRQS